MPTETDKERNEEVFTITDKMAEFPGGTIAMHKFIAANRQYPQAAKERGIEGMVFVRYCVTSKGDVTNVAIASGIHPLIDREALRIVKSFPKWEPGMREGKAIDTWEAVQIKFKIEKGKKYFECLEWLKYL